MKKKKLGSTKHTPGPWKTVLTDHGNFHMNYAVDAADNSTMMLATVYRHKKDSQQQATAEANARLIAAAPELLSELKHFVALIAAEYPKQQAEWLEGARAAIAKAEGRDE